MDLARIGVMIWLILPAPVFLIARWRRARFEERLPHEGSGTIVAVRLWTGHYGEGRVPMTTAKYTYTVLGNTYLGQGDMNGTHRPGEEIRIRFSTERLGESALDDYTTPRGWIIVGLLILAVDLGLAFITIAVGLLMLLGGVFWARTHVQHSRLRRTIEGGLILTFLGLPWVVVGVLWLGLDGFWSQNMLWFLWNHLPFLP